MDHLKQSKLYLGQIRDRDRQESGQFINDLIELSKENIDLRKQLSRQDVQGPVSKAGHTHSGSSTSKIALLERTINELKKQLLEKQTELTESKEAKEKAKT